MDIASVTLVYFSPTRTTKKVLEGISTGIQVDKVNHIDLTPAETRTQQFKEFQDELAIIGIPAYGGRVPSTAVPRIRRLRANNTPAIIVVVYGNRKYDDALLELSDLAVERGFKPAAAGAFIAEHTLSRADTPIAGGRPDTEDLKKARKFGKEIQEKLTRTKSINDISPLQIPGNFPYIEMPSAKELLQTYPATEEKICIKCETCISVCPTAAITIKETVITDAEACILCHACVKNCPTQARVMDSPRLRGITEFMSKQLSARKEPEIFI